MKPNIRPRNPNFSSGPCAKRPGWTPQALSNALVGRSHRAKAGKARLQEVCDRSRELLDLPNDYRLGIVPASDTGAVEMALWSMLGARGVDVLTWESFGQGWATDVIKQLKLKDARIFDAPYGKLPDLHAVDWRRDVVFTWNGTTSGARVPNGDWIDGEREGLAICDATSAVFAMDLPWHKLDVITWSWQKVLGGEAGHGMLALSPRAVARLQTYSPPWPLPKIFRLTAKGKFNEAIFAAETINTPSMLAVEDAIDGLKWARSIGGQSALKLRSQANLDAVRQWVDRAPWIEFLVREEAIRSWTSVCLEIVDEWFQNQSADRQRAALKKMEALLDEEGVAFDFVGHRDAPPGLRLWCGATVETSDIAAVLPWLDWAFAETRNTVAA
jgi:phosphoserine aminotransferase